MKTERRHALETNTLAAELSIWSEKLRPYTGAILTGIAVVLGLYALLTIWNSRGAALEATAWDKYERALLQGDADLGGVYSVASNEEYAGTTAPEWAYVAYADRQVRLAANEYLIDRDAANEKLNNVEAVYEQFSTQALDPEVRNRARFGLARVCELQNRFDEAREHYAQVQGALASVSAERLAELEDKGQQIEETGKWLASAELPKPAAPPGSGLPDVRPEFDAPPPSVDGTTPFDPSSAIDEFLGDLNSDDPVGGRYGEDGAATPSEGAAEGDAADAEGADDAAGDAPAEPAPESASDATGGEAPATTQSDAAESEATANEEPAADATPAPENEPQPEGSPPAQQ